MPLIAKIDSVLFDAINLINAPVMQQCPLPMLGPRFAMGSGWPNPTWRIERVAMATFETFIENDLSFSFALVSTQRNGQARI